MRLTRNLVLVVVSILVTAPVAAGDDPGPAAAVERFVEALSRADLPALLDQLDENATMFAPFPEAPERIAGQKNIAALFESMFSGLRESGQGPVYMNLVPRDVDTRLLGDTAVVTFHLGQVPQEPLDEAYSFSRRTLVLHREDGRWKVVHLHASSVIIPAAEPEAE